MNKKVISTIAIIFLVFVLMTSTSSVLASYTSTMTSQTDWSGADVIQTDLVNTSASPGDLQLNSGGVGSWEKGPHSAPTKTGYGASLVYNEDTNAIYATPGYDIDNQNNHLRQFWKYDIATNAWSQLAEVPLTYQVQGGGMVYDGSANIYMTAGGARTGFYKYTVATNTWTTVASVPGTVTSGSAMAYDSANNKIYLTRGGTTTEFFMYDPEYNEWQHSYTPMPFNPYYGLASAYDNADIVYTLPIYPNTSYINRYFYKYVISTNSWTALAETPNYVLQGASLAYDGARYVYALRGSGTTTFWRYDTTTDTWATRAVTPSNIASGAGLVYNEDNGKLYATRGGSTTDFWEYDPVADGWTAKTVVTGAVTGSSLGLVYDGNGTIYTAVGGSTATFYKYSVSGNSWSAGASLPAIVNTATGNSLVSDGTYIWALRNTSTGNLYRYTISSNTWTTLDSLSTNVGYGGMVKAGDRIFISLGYVPSTSYAWVGFHPGGTDTAYHSKGTYTSETFDLGTTYAFAGIEATIASASATRVTFETRSSTDSASWSDWTFANNQTSLSTVYKYLINSTVRRYLQIRAKLYSTNYLNTPEIQDLQIHYYSDETAPSNPTVSAYSNSAMATSITTNTWYNHTSPYFTFGGSGDGNGGSGINGYYVYFGQDSAVDASTSGTLQTAANYTLSPVNDGEYYLKVRAKDNAGNIGTNSDAVFHYRLDTQVPDKPSSLAVDPRTYTSVNSFTVYWPTSALSDALKNSTSSGVLGAYYKTGASSGALSAYQLAASTQVDAVTAYQQGANAFYLKSRDNAGNESEAASTSYYYNGSAPSPPQNLAVTPETDCRIILPLSLINLLRISTSL